MRGGGIALVAAALLAACAPPPRAAGERPRPTLVSLNPCSDAILAEVADPRQILAISAFSHDPAASSLPPAVARRFRAVSGSAEEVLALDPDIVIGDRFVAPATRAAFAELGLRLEQVPIPVTVEQARAQVRLLARLAGHPRRGEALVARIDAALAAAAPPPGASPVGAIVWQSGGIVPGQGTLVADLLRRTGFRNLSAARGLGQADHLPLERMLADPPRVILAAGGQAGADEDRLLSHPALAGLAPGTLRERFPPALLWCGGPTIVRAVARLADVRRKVTREKPRPLPLILSPAKTGSGA